MGPKAAWKLGKQTITAWSDDRASSMGAALSYYTLFSIAPLLLIVISVAGLFFGDAAARGEIMGELHGLLGTDGARAVEALLKSVNKPTEGIIATVAGVVALLVGATGVFAELQNDLDRIWRAPVNARSSGVWNLLRTRLIRAWEQVQQPQLRLCLELGGHGRYLYAVQPHSLFMGGIQFDIERVLEDESTPAGAPLELSGNHA